MNTAVQTPRTTIRRKQHPRPRRKHRSNWTSNLLPVGLSASLNLSPPRGPRLLHELRATLFEAKRQRTLRPSWKSARPIWQHWRRRGSKLLWPRSQNPKCCRRAIRIRIPTMVATLSSNLGHAPGQRSRMPRSLALQRKRPSEDPQSSSASRILVPESYRTCLGFTSRFSSGTIFMRILFPPACPAKITLVWPNPSAYTVNTSRPLNRYFCWRHGSPS